MPNPLINEVIIGLPSTAPPPEPAPESEGRLGMPLINEPIIAVTTPAGDDWVVG